jgi:hypothetical protein
MSAPELFQKAIGYEDEVNFEAKASERQFAGGRARVWASRSRARTRSSASKDQV